GYSRAIADTQSPDSFGALRIQGEDKPGSLGPKVIAYSSHEATNPFGLTKLPPRLAVKEPPALEVDPIANWANVNDFGADPTGEKDSSVAIQKALDSGAKTIFLPGFYSLESPLRIRGNVQRLLGVGAWIDYHRRVTPDLIIEQGSAPVVTIEHLDHVGGGILIDTNRTVVLKSLGPKVIQCKRVGELFLEDVTTDDLVLQQNQSLWARQLNVENEGTHVANAGGKLWVLGYKTERGGTLLRTS
ncbi:MAG: glycosyl hydrolase family 28-related protein, partial [Pirellula sp.]